MMAGNRILDRSASLLSSPHNHYIYAYVKRR